uniref:Uncharacterized protein n=1 Tax=Anopheles coluzzii TaxID=1518534 RepID=A0A8W7PFK5_ANOCL
MRENSVRKERKDPQQQQQQQQQKGPNERRCEEGSISETPSQARSTWLKMVNQASEKTELFWGGRRDKIEKSRKSAEFDPHFREVGLVLVVLERSLGTLAVVAVQGVVTGGRAGLTGAAGQVKRDTR